MKEKILTIDHVNFNDKWVEFYFLEEKKYKDVLDENYKPTGGKEETWGESCKYYKLVEEAEKVGYNITTEETLIGAKVKFIHDGLNWEIAEFILPFLYNTPIQELHEHISHLEKQLGWHLNTATGEIIEQRVAQYKQAIKLISED